MNTKKLIIITILTLFSFGFTGAFGATITGAELKRVQTDFDERSDRIREAIQDMPNKLDEARRMKLQELIEKIRARAEELPPAAQKAVAIRVLGNIRENLNELGDKFRDNNPDFGQNAKQLAAIVERIQERLQDADEQDLEQFRETFRDMLEKIKKWKVVSALRARDEMPGSSMY